MTTFFYGVRSEKYCLFVQASGGHYTGMGDTPTLFRYRHDLRDVITQYEDAMNNSGKAPAAIEIRESRL